MSEASRREDISKDKYTIVAISYVDRIYFFKIFLYTEEIVPSRRIRFKSKRIIEILKMNENFVGLIMAIEDKA